MTRYRVHRRERWIQTIIVEAKDTLEARLKALDGDGEIYDDPEYSGDIELTEWKIDPLDERKD